MSIKVSTLSDINVRTGIRCCILDIVGVGNNSGENLAVAALGLLNRQLVVVKSGYIPLVRVL